MQRFLSLKNDQVSDVHKNKSDIWEGSAETIEEDRFERRWGGRDRSKEKMDR